MLYTRDTILPGLFLNKLSEILFCGYIQDSWRVAMRYKAKRERSKLRMQDNTEKQASPRNQPRASRDPNPKRVTRPGTVGEIVSWRLFSILMGH